MEHWFDSFSRSLALGAVSRREALRFLMWGGLWAIWPRFSWAQGSLPARPTVRPGECVTSRSATEKYVGYAVQSTFEGQPLRLTWDAVKLLNQLQRNRNRFIGGKMPSTLVMSLTLGNRQLAKIQVNNSGEVDQPNTIQTTFEYGEGLGIRRARISVFNEQVQGDIDNRPFKPFSVARRIGSLNDLEFVDRKPPPKLTIDPKLATAVNNLTQYAQEAVRTCRTLGTSTPAPIFARPQIPEPHPGHEAVRPFFSISSGQQQACNDCTDNCEEQWGICQGLDAGGTVAACLLCPPCCPVAVGVGAGASGICDGDLATCVGLCIVPGHACCPVFCSFSLNPSEGCCDSGETCVQQNDPEARDGCCPNARTCSGRCCPPGDTCCGGDCCPSGQCQPGNVCCPPGQRICNGTCCANGVCDSTGNCCPSPSHICGGACCPPFNTCCVGTCCNSNDVCINNICCPKAQSCGSVCCASGQFCSQGQCVTGCPDGMDVSTAPDGSMTCCPLYQCDNPSNDNICVEASCPGGACCGPNQVCCPTGFAGTYRCSNPPCLPVIQ